MPTIAHITPYMDASAGGPPVVVDKLVDHAPDFGWNPLIVTTDAFTSDRGKALSQRKGVTVFSGLATLLKGAERRQLEAVIKSADIVHCHTLWSPLVSLSARIARQNKIPYILSPHGMLDPYSLSQKALKKRVYLSVVEQATLRRAERLLFTTTEEKILAEQKLGGGLMSDVIGLGAEAPEATREEMTNSFLAEHPDLADKKLIVFCGRMHEKKRPEVLVAAMPSTLEKEPSATLLFVGSGDPELITKLEHSVHDLGIQHAVRFLGFLTGHEKWRALAASKLFVLPSHQENFGIAAAEAMRVGLPVLLTRRVNIWRDIVENGGGVALDEDRLAASVSEQVVNLLRDDELCQKLSQNARAFADANYTWPRSAELTHRLYDEIIAAPSAGTP